MSPKAHCTTASICCMCHKAGGGKPIMSIFKNRRSICFGCFSRFMDSDSALKSFDDWRETREY